MSDVQSAMCMTALAMTLVVLAGVVGLVALDVDKQAHMAAGGHEPTPQAECYELPGHGELATLGTLTYCRTHN